MAKNSDYVSTLGFQFHVSKASLVKNFFGNDVLRQPKHMCVRLVKIVLSILPFGKIMFRVIVSYNCGGGTTPLA